MWHRIAGSTVMKPLKCRKCCNQTTYDTKSECWRSIIIIKIIVKRWRLVKSNFVLKLHLESGVSFVAYNDPGLSQFNLLHEGTQIYKKITNSLLHKLTKMISIFYSETAFI